MGNQLNYIESDNDRKHIQEKEYQIQNRLMQGKIRDVLTKHENEVTEEIIKDKNIKL